jgi:putative transposase
LRAEVRQALDAVEGARLTAVLKGLGIAPSTWYRQAVPVADRQRPGPEGKPIGAEVERWVVTMAVGNPWYGYKRIAVMCRRAGQAVTNRQAYRVMKQHDLLVKRQPAKAAVYQAAKLWELLPQGPNDLWQMDVTYVHIPGYGWWYVITVIDYYSRYLLAAYLTCSYSAAEAIVALGRARREAERIHGPLPKRPFLVTDNGPSFVAKRFGRYIKDVYSHVRIQYRTPTQLGLLERFHCTLKQEEVYWRLYESPAHARECLEEFSSRYNTRRPHWALVPASGGDPLTPEEVYAQGRVTQIPRWQAWARRAKAELQRLLEDVA